MALDKATNQPSVGRNTQHADTPVAILTYGGKKRLFFGYGEDKTSIQDGSTFYIEQSDTKIVLLHWEDEKWRLEETMKRFLHMSAMHPDPQYQDDVVMSIMFRHCSATEKVHRNTSHFVNTPQRGDIHEFDAIRDTWVHDSGVAEDQAALMGKVQNYYNRTDN